jgi:hypothetical protein
MQPVKKQGHANNVLRRGGHHHHLPVEPGAHQGPQRITPYEAWHGHRPDVQHLRTFSCMAFIKATSPHLRNLDDRGMQVEFIGYE